MPANTAADILIRIEVAGANLPRTARAFEGVAGAAEQAAASVEGVRRSTYSAGRELYRYTFYALWFAQLVNAYLGTRLLRTVVRPVAEAEMALARFRIATQATAEELALASEQATRLALRGLGSFREAVAGMEAMAKAGLGTREAIEAIGIAAQLAALEGVSLARAGEFLATAMIVFRMNTEQARVAMDQFLVAARESKYGIQEMMYALDMTMAVAAAFGQQFDQLLTLLTIFGKMGFPAAQAATMINQVFTRLGDPETLAFMELGLEYFQTLPGVAERLGGRLPALFTEAGLGDLTEAVIAVAEAFQHAIETADDKVQAWRAAFLVLNRVFGVRNIRAFLALAEFTYEGERGVAAYRKLLETIRASRGELEKAYGQVQRTYATSVMILRNAMELFRIQIGTTTTALLNPLARLMAQLTATLANLMAMYPGLRNFVGLFFTLGTALSVAAAVAGTFAVVLTLIAGKLRDFGQQPEVQQWLAQRGLQATTYTRAGFLYVTRGFFLPVLRMTLAIVNAIAMAFLAWQYNLGGVREALEPFIKRMRAFLDEDLGERAKRAAERVRRAFQQPTPAGAFFQGVGRGFLQGLSIIVRAYAEFFKAMAFLSEHVLSATRAVLRFIFYIPAFILGLGNVEKGFRRLGQVLGWILGILAGFAAFRLIHRGFVSAFNILVRIWRFLFPPGPGGLVRRLLHFPTQTWLFQAAKEVVRGLFRGLLSRWGWFPETAPSRGFYGLLYRLAHVLGHFLRLSVIWLERIFFILLKIMAAQVKSLLSFLRLPRLLHFGVNVVWPFLWKGMAGLFGMLVTNPWWFLGALALGGLGYGLYRLLSRPASRPDETFGALPLTPTTTVSNVHVNFTPTIVVPQGTTQEQAEYILEHIKAHAYEIFQVARREEEFRAFTHRVRSEGLHAA